MKFKRFLILKQMSSHNLLQEEPELQELSLLIDGKHEGDLKKPRETLTAG